jgi:hypothetical protein
MDEAGDVEAGDVEAGGVEEGVAGEAEPAGEEDFEPVAADAEDEESEEEAR